MTPAAPANDPTVAGARECRLVILAGKDPTHESSGGHSSYVRAYARAACAAGYRPEIYCIGNRAASTETPYGTVRAVPLLRCLSRNAPHTSVRSRQALWHVWALQRALRAALRDERRPMLVHGIGIWTAAAIPLVRSLRAEGRRIACIANVYTLYSEEYHGKWKGAVRAYGRIAGLGNWLQWQYARIVLAKLERSVLRGVDVLLGNYESVRNLIEREHGALPHYRLFPYAPETAFLPEADAVRSTPPPALSALRPTDAPCIVCVSRHDPRKGIDILLEALALLRQRGVPFRACVVSGGTLLEANRRMAMRLGLPPDQVILPGYVEDVRGWLAAADIYCLPSLEEQSGSVSLLEAMQAGRACVATAIDGIPEDVTHGEHAWLVPAHDPVALADGLARLAGDPALRLRLGDAARTRYRERFAAAGLTAALGALYAEVLDRP